MEATGMDAEELTTLLKELSQEEYDLGRQALEASQMAITFKDAIDATIKCPAVPTNVINTVLKRYLENDTQDLPIVINKSEKLSSVGCCANILGGNLNNSSKGLSALLTAKIIGKAIM